MSASSVLLLLLVLICPLGMMWMMRGGHGHGHGHGSPEPSGHDRNASGHAPLMRERSTKGLRELRDEIDQMIEERERAERRQSEPEPTLGTRR